MAHMDADEYDKKRPFFGAASGFLFAVSAVTESIVIYFSQEQWLDSAAPHLAAVQSSPTWLSPLIIGVACVAMPAALGVCVGLFGIAFERGRRLISMITVVANLAMICSGGGLLFKSEPVQPCTDSNQCIRGSRIECDPVKRICVEPKGPLSP